MVENVLTKETIITAGEDVLRRFGPEKASLSDVAKVMKVSHAAIYRYFKNKKALWDAIAEKWLDRISQPLNIIMDTTYTQASEKMEKWLSQLAESKRKSALEDPEMFRLYAIMADHSGEVLRRHLDMLTEQLAAIFRDGVRTGEFAGKNDVLTARTLLNAFTCFHNPAFADEWSRSSYQNDFKALWLLVRDGLIRQ
jgi:Transcriptional regulator